MGPNQRRRSFPYGRLSSSDLADRLSKIDRRHPAKPGKDQRTETARDRDRILYSQPFLRLAGVTQVVTPREGLIFHSRLTHSLKVGQLAKRLAEFLQSTHPDEVSDAGGIDPEVAEAAGFAHDVGHPPFGHAAEQELRALFGDQLGRPADEVEGYEGNAQSFRVVTKLAAHRAVYPGLNLTRVTLSSVLKYPWTHDPTSKARRHKYGAYLTEADDLKWAESEGHPGEPSLEAQVMDLADDITYSVHDLQDFFRAGLINPAAIRDNLETYLSDWYAHLDREAEKSATHYKRRIARAARAQATTFYVDVLGMLLGHTRYTANFASKTLLDFASSNTIGRILRSTTLQKHDGLFQVDIPDDSLSHLKFLQRVVWTEVIESPRLASQQEGQRKIVRELFGTFLGWIETERYSRLPPVLAELAESAITESSTGDSRRLLQLRFAADVVASLTDAEATSLYHRLTGASLGSITDLMPSSFS